MENLALEAETAISLLDIRECNHIRYLVTNNLKTLIRQHADISEYREYYKTKHEKNILTKAN